jgi:putative oxidoreductase
MFAQKYTPLLARTFIAVIFIQTGIANLIDFTGTQQQIASAGIPIAVLVAFFTVVFEIVGGFSLLFGYKARLGAVLLLLFLIPATLMFHNPIADSAEVIPFMKNLAIIGGLMMIGVYGSGPLSLQQQKAPMSSVQSESARHFEDRLR